MNVNVGRKSFYGGCGLTVMTRGCGPRNEGSTPSFRFFLRKKFQSGVFDIPIRASQNLALNQILFDLFANFGSRSPSA